MTAQGVLKILGVLRAGDVRFWLDGGWGVDALLGTQTRDHADLDLVIDRLGAPELRSRLEALGFRCAEERGDNFVMSHPELGSVDVHGIRFDARGFGIFDLEDGREWPFPPSAFAASGTVGTESFPCLSAEAQVQCHGQGYAPTENDLRDMAQLQERLGVVLPLALCRQESGGS